MKSLAEIEAAADSLSRSEKQQLLVFLASRLRAESGSLPEPRKFSSEQVASWIEEDERDMAQFRQRLGSVN